jgi:gluconolactonase
MNSHVSEQYVESYNDAGKAIFPSDAALTLLADGFRFLEGPAWHPAEQHLTFSDIMGNALYRRFGDGRIEMIRPNSYLANGNSYDREGRLVTCEHGTSRVTRTGHDGSVTVLASHYRGKELNSPNDIVVKSDGSIYFTDPNPGRCPRVGIPRKQELDFQGVYRIDGKTGELVLLADDFSKPNGLCFSPDETLLYVNDTDHQHIRVFGVKADGTLEKGRLFADLLKDGPGVADGMKFDSAGNLFCSAPRGIQIFDEEGKLTARLFTPEVAANFTWGGKDLKTLFLTATTGLYSIPVRIPGLPLF